MRAHLRSIYSSDISVPVEDYAPDDPEHFGFWAQVFIGSSESGPVDSFDALVCTPSWLAENFEDPRVPRWTFEPPGVLFGSRCIFLKRWDYPALNTAVIEVLAFHEAREWGTLANRIGRFIPWEFDYRYDAEVDRRDAELPPVSADEPGPGNGKPN